MLLITKKIADANMVTDAEKIDKLDAILKQQANNGVTVQQALDGHCPQAASNPTFVNNVCSSLTNHEGVPVTPTSPLMAAIHVEHEG